MIVIPRSAWGARAPSYTSYMSLPVSRLFVHHTVGASPTDEAGERAEMRAVQNFHIDGRHWSDIAYSFVVFPSGRIYEGRGWGRTGGHTLNYNSISHAICHAGNYESQTPTTAQLDSTRWLIAEGKRLGKHTANVTIQGHRDVGTTACPGARLYAELPYIRTPYEQEDGVSKQDVLDATGLTEGKLEQVFQFLAGQLEHETGRKRGDILPDNAERLAGWDYADKINPRGTE